MKFLQALREAHEEDENAFPFTYCMQLFEEMTAVWREEVREKRRGLCAKLETENPRLEDLISSLLWLPAVPPCQKHGRPALRQEYLRKSAEEGVPSRRQLPLHREEAKTHGSVYGYEEELLQKAWKDTAYGAALFVDPSTHKTNRIPQEARAAESPLGVVAPQAMIPLMVILLGNQMTIGKRGKLGPARLQEDGGEAPPDKSFSEEKEVATVRMQALGNAKEILLMPDLRVLHDNLVGLVPSLLNRLDRLERRGVRWTAEEVAACYTMEQFLDYLEARQDDGTEAAPATASKSAGAPPPTTGAPPPTTGTATAPASSTAADGRPVPPDEGADQPEDQPSSSTPAPEAETENDPTETGTDLPATNEARQSAVDRYFL
eukprot:s561_g23.t2